MKKMMIMSLGLSLMFLLSSCATTVRDEPRMYDENDTDLSTPEQVRNEVGYDDATRYDNNMRTTSPKDKNYNSNVIAPNKVNDNKYNNRDAKITMREAEIRDNGYEVNRVVNDRGIDAQLLKRATRDAKNVCTRLNGMPGVDDVSCVVSGDDCFVSVQLDENCTENQKNAVLGDTYMVCKNTNQTLDNVFLNFDSDMHTQIKGYMNQINTSGSTLTPKISQIKSSMQDVTIR